MSNYPAWRLCSKCKHIVKFFYGSCENCGYVEEVVIIRSSDNSGGK